MSIKIGINGFGRIGRNVLRAAAEMESDLEVVAINDIGDPRTFAHLLKHDTAMGTFGPAVEARGDEIVVGGRGIRFLSLPEIGAQPWGELGAEIVIESTGHCTDGGRARAHIDRGGARKVVISAPAKNHDATLVMGINHCSYDPARHHVVSMGSCTTNCLVPVVKVLNEIYEEDFRNFSYGFRPGRGQHMALDALYVAIKRKRVNWDCRSGFEKLLRYHRARSHDPSDRKAGG